MKVHSGIERVRNMLMETLGHSVANWGMSPTLGRLYGLLYFADEPMSLDQMAKELMVSKATVSINIRILESVKCVQKVWQKGSRKDFYIAENDFEKMMQEFLRTNAQTKLKIQKEVIFRAITELEELLQSNLPQDVEEQAKKDLEKIYHWNYWLQISEKWFNFFLESELTDEPKAPLQRINVEWGDEE